MDRKYYYRMFGLQEGASAAKIEEAYKEKIRKLDSPDYADDPEYVNRKKKQLKEAYNVLTGRTAPVSRSEKERRFEKFKDMLDSEEGFDDERLDREEEKQKRSTVRLGSSRGKSNSSKRMYENQASGGKLTKTIFIVIFLIVWGIGFFGGMLGLIFGEGFEENYDRLSAMENSIILNGYDYDSWLDDSNVSEYKEYVDWESVEYSDDFYDPLEEIAYSMDVSGFEYIVEYVTGDEDYYYENDDYKCAEKVVEFMQAPSFEEVAGCRNLYSDYLIFTYEEYLWFLADVASHQSIIIAPSVDA